MTECNICESPIDVPIYVSTAHRSLTSLSQVHDQATQVYFCNHCEHLQTAPIIPIDDYYAHQYELFVSGDDDDLLYAVVNGRPVYHSEHRIQTLLNKLSIRTGAHVLDFGCAKGATLKALRSIRPDVIPYYYDVTDRYTSYWRREVDRPQWSVQTLPTTWQGKMDLVCSFYVLEHVLDPVATVRSMAELLADDGYLYFAVPNALANPADMIVADHLQHFGVKSLELVLRNSGLDLVEIDTESHASAYVVIARKARAARGGAKGMAQDNRTGRSVKEDYARYAELWSTLSSRIRDFEATVAGERPACIYGAGFYGNFVASSLRHPENIACFVDQNAHLQGREILGKRIVAPADVDASIAVVYVGLNPKVARKAIQSIACWQNRPWSSFFI